MDTIIATFDAIARRAPDADRNQAAALQATILIMEEAAKAAMVFGTMTDAMIVETGEASRLAYNAVDKRIDDIMVRQSNLIRNVAEDRPSRDILAPMCSPQMLAMCIDNGKREVTFIARERGEFIDVYSNGVVIGQADAYSLSVEQDELVIKDVSRWPLANIEAAGGDEDIIFAFLLDNGTLIEIIERP